MAAFGVSSDAATAIRTALGWRNLQQILICPASSLPGTSFDGFGSGELRSAYIAAGIEAAQRILP